MARTGKGLPRSLAGAEISAAWDDVTGKPAVIAAGATAAAAWGVIQSGAIGTTATTAMAGNKVPTATQRGGVLLQTAQADVAAAPTMEEFNALLAKLRAAGIITT
ncbi:hypothetical protein D3C80_262610 [compost metagenome]